ncbi:GtrA family protein [Euhalothece natronophila]|uniref:GtrA family protein n=1 Tax=Euhalothece natronophila TaxID=577489 RepID=UPI001644D21C|nr:GtrA family protein [Euhalothece natronophila]
MLNWKLIKFLVAGATTTLVNVLLIFFFVEVMGLNTPSLRNLANIIAIELSVLLTFFIYRVWVWPMKEFNFRDILFRQIPMFHMVAGLAISLRVLILFPLLDYIGVNYIINTIIGIAVGSVLNYFVSDRFIFR